MSQILLAAYKCFDLCFIYAPGNIGSEHFFASGVESFERILHVDRIPKNDGIEDQS